MDLKEIDKVLEGLRRGLNSDGADLVVNSVENNCVDLSLIFKENTCLECIVDTEMLLAKIRIVLGKVLPTLPRIALHDPRMRKEDGHDKLTV